MKKVCRYIPTEEEVLTFLKSLAMEHKEDPVLPTHASSASPVDVPPVSDLPRKKSPQRTRVVVTMPDGEIVECPKIRDTFSEVIKKLGVEKVAALGIIRDKIPLVSDSEYPDYAQRQSGSHYINVDAPTPDKKRDLMKIAKDLGVELKVEIIPK